VWDIAGKWLSVASNDYDTTFIVSQHGTHLSGSASIPASEAANSGYSTGTFTGTMIGQKFTITVIWAPRASDGVSVHGRYTGTVVNRHIVKGLGVDLTDTITRVLGGIWPNEVYQTLISCGGASRVSPPMATTARPLRGSRQHVARYWRLNDAQ
jgi:hypothetical protein